MIVNSGTKEEMLREILRIRKLIGNTPVVSLKKGALNAYAKLEYQNYSGSIKDRAVTEVLYQGVASGQITSRTTVIESSSGNFAISAALHCQRLNLKFIAVVDPNINTLNLRMLELIATKVIMVNELDETGGYLLNRIRKVKSLVRDDPDMFWTNQYENENNYKGYRRLAAEIRAGFPRLDYLFVAVSSCGTCRGMWQYLQGFYPNMIIVAIDIEGSQIFSDQKIKRHISGLGASKRSLFLNEVSGIEHVILTHEEIINGCRELLTDFSLFTGGSSGACYAGAIKYLHDHGDESSVSLLLLPDKGFSYLDTIYSDRWANEIINVKQNEQCTI